MHERGTKLRCPFQSSLPAIPTMFTHFYSDRIVIPWTIKVSMFSLLNRRQVLYDNVLLNSKMPGQISYAISISSFRGPQFAFFQCPSMVPSVTIIVLSGMDSNVTRLHCSLIFPAIPALWYESFHYPYFPIKLSRWYWTGPGFQWSFLVLKIRFFDLRCRAATN